MTILLSLLYWILVIAVGGVLVGYVRFSFKFDERIALALVTGLCLCTAGNYLTMLTFGVSKLTAVVGPFMILLLSAIGYFWCGNPLLTWKQSWKAQFEDKQWMVRAGIFVLAGIVIGFLFTRTLYWQDGAWLTNYPTVWADWALHATLANSFAIAHNFPSLDPIFSGAPLRYPFAPDFQSAVLIVLGWSVGPALSLPSALLALAIVVLVVSLVQRLSGSLLAGSIVVLICVLGSGLGFVDIVGDACLHTVTINHSAADQPKEFCSWGHFINNPADQKAIISDVAQGISPVITNQPRSYDSTDNRQWYTPLFAWWLPQRGFLYGFAVAMTVWLLITTASSKWHGEVEEKRRRQWPAFFIVGLLIGLLPFFQIHTLVVIAMILPFYAFRFRGKEWWALLGLSLVIAVPRVLSLENGPSGSWAQCNQFPRLEPGWLARSVTSDSAVCNYTNLSLGNVIGGVFTLIRSIVSYDYWSFWISNTGILLPIFAVVAISLWLVYQQYFRAPQLAKRIKESFPEGLLYFTMPFLLVFLLANLVVFQGWDWDNTKILLYWQFAAAILAATWLAKWIKKQRWGVTSMAGVIAISLLLTGGLTFLRTNNWGPPTNGAAGPFILASAAQVDIGNQIVSKTPNKTVILTAAGTEDPASTVAGRTIFMGYYGWLWNFGANLGNRLNDAPKIYRGCSNDESNCPVKSLLKQYHIEYVEIAFATDSTGFSAGPNLPWWLANYQVVAQNNQYIVFDVHN